MHASIWRFTGDPETLLAGYDGLAAEIPADALLVHLVLRTPDGMIVVDTCPTEEAWLGFSTSPDFAAMRGRHGLPDPVIEAHPVHRVVANAAAVAAA